MQKVQGRKQIILFYCCLLLSAYCFLPSVLHCLLVTCHFIKLSSSVRRNEFFIVGEVRREHVTSHLIKRACQSVCESVC